jgi:hypothetical protein
MSEQQKDPGQPLFARIEKLINQIFFVTDVPRHCSIPNIQCFQGTVRLK